MKVLFLDIDGVLITEASARYYRWVRRSNVDDDKGWRRWCPIATNNLRILLARIPDMQIVLSSSWRCGRSVTECADLLEENGLDRTRLIDRTCQLGDKRRGDEIQEWLDTHTEVTHFAILDDDSDMDHLMPFLVKTDFEVGMTLGHNRMIAGLLGTPGPRRIEAKANSNG